MSDSERVNQRESQNAPETSRDSQRQPERVRESKSETEWVRERAWFRLTSTLFTAH